MTDITPNTRSPRWTWTVCVLLLMATMLNYMDRLTLTQTAARIIAEYDLSRELYGQIESAFAIAFAVGGITVGLLVDRWNVWWMYPTVVFLWSLAGFAAGFVQSYEELLMCRVLLGLAEAGHWPCALRTTQRILAPAQRTLGNSLLQSGAAVGAVLTPLIVNVLVGWTNSWRPPFLVVGALGVFWVVLWLAVVRREDLALPPPTPALSQDSLGEPSIAKQEPTFLEVVLQKRFFVLLLTVICINTTWHYFRVWMPLFLQEIHGYSESAMNYFTAGYYLSTDAGTLSAGFATLWLARRMPVHTSRLLVFGLCATLTMLSVVLTGLDRGPMLLGILLAIGFGALGLFPPYYSFTQEISVRHQGKITGLLGASCWLAMAPVHLLVGRLIDQTKSYTLPLSIVGFLPMLGFLALLLFWKNKETAKRQGESEA